MKALRRYEYGTPRDLRIEELPVPTPSAGEILVRVRASTVSRTDCALLGAHPFVLRFMTGLWHPNEATLGTDFAGEVAAIGPGVGGFSEGDRVWGINDMGARSHAEYAVFRANDAIAPLPATLSFEDAAASLEGPWYAYSMMERAGLARGAQVLINGATGAIGAALLQLCLWRGASVTAVGNAKNLELLKSLGAARVIDYEQQDFTQDPTRYDFVFDAVGKSTFGKCRPLLTPGGVYSSSELGPFGQNLFFALVPRWLRPQRVVFPVPIDRKRFLGVMGEIVAGYPYRPVIERSYSLDEAGQAYSYAASGQKTGSILLTFTP